MFNELTNDYIKNLKKISINLKLDNMDENIMLHIGYPTISKLLPNIANKNLSKINKFYQILKTSILHYLSEMISEFILKTNNNFELITNEQIKSKFLLLDTSRSNEFYLKNIYNNDKLVLFIGDYDLMKLKCKVLSYIEYGFKYIILINPTILDKKIINYENGSKFLKIGLLNFADDYMEEDVKTDFFNNINIVNSAIPDLIGYDVSELCDSASKENFKEKIKSSILNTKSCVYDGLYENNKSKFNYNIHRNINVILGNKNYAESFFTSEWLYTHNLKNDELEKTYIIAGYLKSIEQLLAQVCIIKGQKKVIQTFNGNQIISGSDLTKINSSICMLVKFIKDNNIINTNNYLINNLCLKIQEWKFHSRNGHFHKDNIDVLSDVNDVRNKTFEIMYLLLGSLDINDSEMKEFI